MEGHDWVGITAANGRQWVCRECEAERWESRDARDEAERIVARHELLVVRQPLDGVEAKAASTDRLVSALAAAIEVDEADGRQGLGAALDRLTEALSALRSTTEEQR